MLGYNLLEPSARQASQVCRPGFLSTTTLQLWAWLLTFTALTPYRTSKYCECRQLSQKWDEKDSLFAKGVPCFLCGSSAGLPLQFPGAGGGGFISTQLPKWNWKKDVGGNTVTSELFLMPLRQPNTLSKVPVCLLFCLYKAANFHTKCPYLGYL